MSSPPSVIRRVLVLEGASPTGESLRAVLTGLLPEIAVHVASTATQAHLMLYSVRPDVALLDVNAAERFMPYISRQALAQNPPVRLILVAGHEDDDRILPGLRAGAAGYLLRSAPPEEQTKRLRAALLGVIPLDASLARQIVRHSHRAMDPGMFDARERELLGWVAAGDTLARVAERIAGGEAAARRAVAGIYGKLGLPAGIGELET